MHGDLFQKDFLPYLFFLLSPLALLSFRRRFFFSSSGSLSLFHLYSVVLSVSPSTPTRRLITLLSIFTCPCHSLCDIAVARRNQIRWSAWHRCSLDFVKCLQRENAVQLQALKLYAKKASKYKKKQQKNKKEMMFPRWHLTLQLRGNLLFLFGALCTRDTFTFFICILPLFFLSSATRNWQRCFSIILLLLKHVTRRTQISADVIITALNIPFKLCWHAPLNASRLVRLRFLSSVFTCACLFLTLSHSDSRNVNSKVSKLLGFEINSGLLCSRCIYSLSHKSKNNPSERKKFFCP